MRSNPNLTTQFLDHAFNVGPRVYGLPQGAELYSDRDTITLKMPGGSVYVANFSKARDYYLEHGVDGRGEELLYKLFPVLRLPPEQWPRPHECTYIQSGLSTTKPARAKPCAYCGRDLVVEGRTLVDSAGNCPSCGGLVEIPGRGGGKHLAKRVADLPVTRWT